MTIKEQDEPDQSDSDDQTDIVAQKPIHKFSQKQVLANVIKAMNYTKAHQINSQSSKISNEILK